MVTRRRAFEFFPCSIVYRFNVFVSLTLVSLSIKILRLNLTPTLSYSWESQTVSAVEYSVIQVVRKRWLMDKLEDTRFVIQLIEENR